MAPVPARADAPHPLVLSLPPSLLCTVACLVACGLFSAGIFVGMSMWPPPSVERCFSASDPIGCLIQILD